MIRRRIGDEFGKIGIAAERRRVNIEEELRNSVKLAGCLQGCSDAGAVYDAFGSFPASVLEQDIGGLDIGVAGTPHQAFHRVKVPRGAVGFKNRLESGRQSFGRQNVVKKRSVGHFRISLGLLSINPKTTWAI